MISRLELDNISLPFNSAAARRFVSTLRLSQAHSLPALKDGQHLIPHCLLFPVHITNLNIRKHAPCSPDVGLFRGYVF
jgi:hypothetical protein